MADAAANVERLVDRTDPRRIEAVALIAGIGSILVATLWLAVDLVIQAPTV
ncbi:hypothetical protein [Pandoraea sputorum]|uniref:hypothetical protein n=1 Tax=Pandoraea sputorum TaxID=93222 RepID=UPI00177D9839|nr:hypothetical protein [Pandoraea sputorum]